MTPKLNHVVLSDVPALSLKKTLEALREAGYALSYVRGNNRDERRAEAWRLCRAFNIQPIGFHQSKDTRLAKTRGGEE